MSLKKRLDAELKTVAFPSSAKDKLKRELRRVVEQKAAKKNPSQRLHDFWHGSTEIPLPVGGLLLFLAALGIYSAYSTLVFVNQDVALALLELGRKSLTNIDLGVSVL